VHANGIKFEAHPPLRTQQRTIRKGLSLLFESRSFFHIFAKKNAMAANFSWEANDPLSSLSALSNRQAAPKGAFVKHSRGAGSRSQQHYSGSFPSPNTTPLKSPAVLSGAEKAQRWRFASSNRKNLSWRLVMLKGFSQTRRPTTRSKPDSADCFCFLSSKVSYHRC